MKKALALLLVVGVIATGTTLGSASPNDPERAPTTNWLQYRGRQQRAGFNPSETQITPASLASHGGLRLRKVMLGYPWEFTRPTSPVIYNGTLFSSTAKYGDPGDVEASGTRLWAMDAETGALRWSSDIACKGPSGVPAISVKAQVIVVPTTVACGTSGSGDGLLVGIDLATHSERWNVTRSPWSTPAVVGETVYASTVGDGGLGLYSIDAATGDERWHVEKQFGAPAVGGGVVYARESTASGRTLTALDAATGDRLWSRGSEVGDPVISAGRIYVPCTQGTCSYNRAGTLKWSFPGSGEVSIAQGKVFLGCDGDDGNNLCALNAKTGALVWQGWSPTPVSASTVAGGVVYSQPQDNGSYSYVSAWDASTGEHLADFGGVSGDRANIVVANGKVYLVDGNRIYVYALA